MTRGALSGVDGIIVTESSAQPAQVIKSAPAPGDSGKSRKEAMRAFWLLLGIAALAPARTWADEGMWTFDNFPSEAVKQAYGVEITPAWLDHVRLSTIRLTNCTASFVSPQGLMLTNHHCVESCLGELSSKENSLLDNGFLAPTPSAERRCATQVADVLVSMENVTAAVTKAVAGFSDEAANDARKRTLTALEQTCEQASARSSSGKLECQAVTLYEGGQYFLYKYKRYDDVRLVFTPETDIAAFGGDPDNFQFPRWALDFAVLRAYEHGKPAKTPDYLKIDFSGPQRGRTGLRLRTSRQHRQARDPCAARVRARRVPAHNAAAHAPSCAAATFNTAAPINRTWNWSRAPLSSLENGIKVRRKLLDALHDDALMDRKKAEESTLRTLANLLRPRSMDADRDRLAPRTRNLSALHLHRRAAPASTASCSATRACCCAERTSAPSRTPSGCANSPTRCCRGSSSSSMPAYPSMRKSRR